MDLVHLVLQCGLRIGRCCQERIAWCCSYPSSSACPLPPGCLVSQRKQDAISRDANAKPAPTILGRRYGYLRLDINRQSEAIHGWHKGEHGFNRVNEAWRDGVFRGCPAMSDDRKYACLWAQGSGMCKAFPILMIKGPDGLAKPMPITFLRGLLQLYRASATIHRPTRERPRALRLYTAIKENLCFNHKGELRCWSIFAEPPIILVHKTRVEGSTVCHLPNSPDSEKT